MGRWLIFVAAPLLAACSGGSSTPPRPRSVARPMTAPAPYRPTQAQSPQGAPAGGPVVWLHQLADAQAQARSSGRLILVGSTKPGCTLCEKFMDEIAPQCGGRLNQLAVAYVYDIMRPENSRIDQLLRRNLLGAILMPLVGFVTADLVWVHGFAGPRTAQEFMGDIETAARLHPRRLASLRSVNGPALAQVSFVNEFGETEWSAPADVWPKPQDALGAQPALAVAAPSTTPAAGVLAAAPATFPAVSPEPVASEPVADPAVGWSPAPAAAAVASTTAPSIDATPSIDPGPAIAPAPHREVGPVVALTSSDVSPAPEPPFVPATLPAPLPPLAAPSPAAIAAVPMDEAAARASLGRAFDLIRQGQYDLARDELRRVSRSLPHTNMGREADRGGVAVYNARRISEADSQQRPDLAAQARKSLTGSMWVALF